MNKKKIFKVATIMTMVAILCGSIYIMANGIGLNDEMDFGAGAYYYADIPNFEKVVNADSYQSGLPTWVAIILFLAWGFLMYKAWCWMEKKKKK